MSIYRIFSLTAIVLTPAAPAAMYAWDVQNTLHGLGYPVWLAWAVGIAAVVGIETTGALTFHNAVTAWRRRSLGAGVVSAAFGAIYAIIMIAGIVLMGVNSGTMAFLVLLTVGAYAGGAVWQSFSEQRAEERAETQDRLALAREERLRLNAMTRAARAGVQVSSGQTGQAGQTGHSVQPRAEQVDTVSSASSEQITDTGRRVRAVQSAHPDWSARKIAQALGVSPTTASKWMVRG